MKKSTRGKSSNRVKKDPDLIELPPVLPNAGVSARYYKSIVKIVRVMKKDLKESIISQYKNRPPLVVKLIDKAMAGDESPFQEMESLLDSLAKKWAAKFEQMGIGPVEKFVKDGSSIAKKALVNQLSAEKIAIEFKPTQQMKEQFRIAIAENVALIKNIPEKDIEKIRQAIFDSYMRGNDLSYLSKEIDKVLALNEKRLKLIVQTQARQFTSIVNRINYMNLGITQARWLHSSAGKEPRPDHVAANGAIYNISEGCKISGEFIQPGELINCRCSGRPIVKRAVSKDSHNG